MPVSRAKIRSVSLAQLFLAPVVLWDSRSLARHRPDNIAAEIRERKREKDLSHTRIRPHVYVRVYVVFYLVLKWFSSVRDRKQRRTHDPLLSIVSFVYLFVRLFRLFIIDYCESATMTKSSDVRCSYMMVKT